MSRSSMDEYANKRCVFSLLLVWKDVSNKRIHEMLIAIAIQIRRPISKDISFRISLDEKESILQKSALIFHEHNFTVDYAVRPTAYC